MRVLITEEFHPVLRESLESAGLQVFEKFDINYEQVCKIIQDYEILIVNSKIRVDRNLIERAPNLKIVGRIGSGMDIFDLEECHRKNVKVLTSPEGNANAVAEHIIGFILSSLNHLQRSQNELLNGEWNRERNRGTELCGKTLSIIGFGHNGRRLSELLQGFDIQILAYDIVPIHTTIKNVKIATMEEIYEKTDILSIHLPLTPSTIEFVNSQYLSNFRKNIILINASRGKICPTQVVLDGLVSGKIKHASLDVYESEPFQVSDALRKFCIEGRLFLTPHVAGWTEESKYKLSFVLAEKIKKDLFS